QRPVEVVNVRVRMSASAARVTLPKERLGRGNGKRAIARTGRAIFDGSAVRTPLYERSRLRPGDSFSGPAIVAEYSATTVVPLACKVSVDANHNMIIEVQ